ncbi:hydroxyacid dehydrogenase [Actinocorallia longicatena]|uniref:Hydroxyacid dehydrogenase n=1 Tax=Actinocorallia longicatena TaxID=111803 RepID=A0ABP6QM83_9ACTN
MIKTVLAMDPSVRATLSLDRLAEIADVDLGLVVTDFADPAAAAVLASAEVLFTCWGCPPLTAGALDRMPRLRAVVHAAGSVKHHVTDACWDRGVLVTSAAVANAVPVAEYTLASILFAGKRVTQIAAMYRSERARADWSAPFPGLGNHRMTVGVVGASLVGRRVLDLLRPFDLDVLLYDPYVDRHEAIELGARPADLDDLAELADVVTIHAPEVPETRHMFDRRRLALMKDGATLVNTARGSLVDTAALTDELVSGRLHAVIDVTDPEFLPPASPLYDLPNVLLTPHIAGSMGNELARMVDLAVEEVSRLSLGVPAAHPVRPEALAHSA